MESLPSAKKIEIPPMIRVLKGIWFFLIVLIILSPLNISAESSLQPPFEAKIMPLPGYVKRLMSIRLWHPGCPVGFDQLAYVKLSYWGYDNKKHQGVLITHRKVANQAVEIFKILYENRFPIGNMSPTYIELPFLTLNNNTESFICRFVREVKEISLHSYGYAIDINPLVNPEVRGNLVLPAEGRAYVDRHNVRPGMIIKNDVVYKAFINRNWKWGGEWKMLKDYMHFEKKQLLDHPAK
jgi:hypothetical protein